jgi:osmotically-inducible protein OsmY
MENLIHTLVVKAAIKKALESNADIEADGIDVAVAGTTVTLHGVVRTMSDKTNAERAVRSVPGVERVQNNLVDLYRVFA